MPKTILSFISLLLVCLAPNTVWGQNVSIQGKLERTEIKTGEQTAVNLIIRTNDLARTKFYIKENPSHGEPYTVIEFGAVDTIDIDGKLKEINARLLLTSFDSTLVTIPPIVVETPEGSAETTPMALNVIQPEVDAKHPESFKDIKSPWDVKLRLRDWLEMILSSWIFWLSILLVYIGYVIYRIVLARKNHKETFVPQEKAIVLSLWEETELALNTLRERAPWKQHLYKEYYSELVDIIKSYLDRSRLWATAEMTSSELSDKVREEKLSKEQIHQIEGILREADLSKFAKSQPSEETAEASLHSAWSLLKSLEDDLAQLTINKEDKP